MCDNPGAGTDRNGFTCMTGSQLNDTRVCKETEECHSALPARYGMWSQLCRELLATPPKPALHDASTGLKAAAATNICGPDSSDGPCPTDGRTPTGSSPPVTPSEAAAGSLLPDGPSGDDPRSRYGTWSLVPRRPEEVATALRFDFDDTRAGPHECGGPHHFSERATATATWSFELAKPQKVSALVHGQG